MPHEEPVQRGIEHQGAEGDGQHETRRLQRHGDARRHGADDVKGNLEGGEAQHLGHTLRVIRTEGTTLEQNAHDPRREEEEQQRHGQRCSDDETGAGEEALAKPLPITTGDEFGEMRKQHVSGGTGSDGQHDGAQFF